MPDPTIDQATDAASEAFADNDRWEAALGKYVRLFSDIEFASFWFAKTWGTTDELAETRRLMFGDRSKYAIALVEKYLAQRDPRLCAQWRDFFEAAISHGKTTRNKIVHNPLMVSVYESEKTGEFSAVTRIALARKDDQYITYDQLLAHLEEVRQLNAKWIRLCINTTNLAFMEPKSDQHV